MVFPIESIVEDRLAKFPDYDTGHNQLAEIGKCCGGLYRPSRFVQPGVVNA